MVEGRELVVVGLSHRTTGVDVRERFAVAPEDVPPWIERFMARRRVAECVLLSTCHRTECYAVGEEGVDVESLTHEMLCASSGLGTEGGEHLSTLRGREAVNHLFRVASGLDSLIIGEPQIQGQVGRAYIASRQGGVGPVLHRLFQSALAAGGHVRAATSIAAGATSIPSAAVRLAKQDLGTLAGRPALVIGTGEMARLSMQCLRRAGIGTVWTASRDAERARRVARPFGAIHVPRDQVRNALDKVDLVISCTDGVGLTRRDVVGRSEDRPLSILDIAVPRNVAAEVGDEEGVHLHNVDDLRAVVDEALQGRLSETRRAEAVVATHEARFWSWYRGRRADTAIRWLRGNAEAIVAEALDAALGPSADDQAGVRVAGRAAMNRLMHGPTTALRWLASGSSGNVELFKDVKVARRDCRESKLDEESRFGEEVGQRRRDGYDGTTGGDFIHVGVQRFG